MSIAILSADDFVLALVQQMHSSPREVRLPKSRLLGFGVVRSERVRFPQGERLHAFPRKAHSTLREEFVEESFL